MSAVLTPAPAATTTPPPVKPIPVPPVGPQPFRWTIEQYRELRKIDSVRDLRTMLIDGEIFLMPPPKPPHDAGLGLTNEWLRSVFMPACHVRCQMGFNIGTRTDPSPDLAVVTGTIRDYAGRTPTEAVMIVEVAESSLFEDTTTKAELYATAGVPEYWVLDLEHRRLLVYRDPEPLPAGLGATAYRTHLVFGPDLTVAPLAAPSASVKVADLLP
jgi:Uma2 family endonuclease